MSRIASLYFAGAVCLVASMLTVALWQSRIHVRSPINQAQVPDQAKVPDQARRAKRLSDGMNSGDRRSGDRRSAPPVSLVMPLADKFANESLSDEAALGAGDNDEANQSGTGSGAALHPVIIRQPSGPPRIHLAGADPQGRASSVACSTCHKIRKPNMDNKSVASLDEFHRGMTFNHGKLVCYACHNPDNADQLRLADGTSVTYTNVMSLCSQCHSKQAESFAHGAHGGMNGFWDLTRGPQTKNNCIDCHDPHEPAYPKMIVSFKPKDRFNEPAADSNEHEGTATDGDH